MTRDPVRTAVRRQRRRRFAHPTDCCAWCDIRQPDVLKRVSRSLLEEHHVVGFANDPDDTVTLCRNCHWLASIAQQDDAVPLRPPTSMHALALASIAGCASYLKAGAGRILDHVETLNQPDRPIKKRPRRAPKTKGGKS